MNDGIFPSVRRIIAIGDLHGDYDALILCLKKAGIINDKLDWIAGNTYVVQVGDVIDGRVRIGTWKGDEEIRIIDLLERLDKKARKFTGRVLLVLGNHEIMNTLGNFSYASTTGIESMGGIKIRRQLFTPGSGSIAKFYANKCFAVIKIGGWIFCHGGLAPKISSAYQIPAINNMMKRYLLGKMNDKQLKTFDDVFMSDQGVLMFRGYGAIQPNCNQLLESLNNLHAEHMVVAHTPQEKINSRCKKKLWRIDVGMSRAFGQGHEKRIQCLEIINNGQHTRILK